ncbi:hypothetical protein [Rhizobium sp. NXC24]|uniref:hypothetical protein n=1 Tax=Rhizobium sp. NXC24 TaxID=2048897 RepID=UPI000CDF3077|nr:hypothetical protein [Rhizobium sp. NXC24]AVA26063.1 hypothetical protein NXC24_PC01635 [Rhizobium sp. NXC24]
MQRRKATFFGLMRNDPCQSALGFTPHIAGSGVSYNLAFAEFDDQGEAYDNAQTAAVQAELDRLLSAEQDAIIAVFTHGWRHDADPKDDNLKHVKELLVKIALRESSEAKPRPVYGIFVCWRGLSFYGNTPVEYTTFWGRQGAARRISNGSVRELFGRLRRYRHKRLKGDGGAPMLVIAGHSFGGLIVYSALEQSLIEAASAEAGHIIPSFADLVLLINPAFEASRYLPVDRLSKLLDNRTNIQLPVFVCACANNDLATKYAFLAGNFISAFKQSTRGDLQRRILNRTVGHVDDFTTHLISTANDSFFLQLKHASGVAPLRQANPFWVVRAEKGVINGHSGIWLKPFRDFLEALLWAKAKTTTGGEDISKREAALGGVQHLGELL